MQRPPTSAIVGGDEVSFISSRVPFSEELIIPLLSVTNYDCNLHKQNVFRSIFYSNDYHNGNDIFDSRRELMGK